LDHWLAWQARRDWPRLAGLVAGWLAGAPAKGGR
jgi:hypothetical protein